MITDLKIYATLKEIKNQEHGPSILTFEIYNVETEIDNDTLITYMNKIFEFKLTNILKYDKHHNTLTSIIPKE